MRPSDLRAAIETAAGRIDRHVRRTPTIELEAGAFGLDCRVVVKLEQLQHSGSFKARGAFNNLLSRDVPAAGVIAASGGNHGAAVAYAARALGHRAEIFVPEIAAPAKVRRLRDYGAVVHQGGARYADALAASERRLAETGAMTVHAYDAPETSAGQGTLARELEIQAGPLDALVVAVGGGGLIAGGAGWHQGRTRIVAVETEGTPTLGRAMEAGRPVDVGVSGLAADALGARRIGDFPFAVLSAFPAEPVVVPDEAVRDAQAALWSELRLIAEPAGAASLAALLSGAWRPPAGARIGIVVCGANCDPASVAG